MDADSSYGGSDITHDSGLGHDNNSLETTVINTHDHTTSSADANNSTSSNDSAYFKNEITLPINYSDETDADKSPHYLTTANLNIADNQDLSNNYSSTHNLHVDTPKPRKKSGIDNPAFQEEETKATNGGLKSTFDENKAYNNGDLNSSVSLGLTSPKKSEELNEAVNLELINLKPGKDVIGPYENGNGLTEIPLKKGSSADISNPYDEYFVPVNEHRKYMRGEKLYLTKDKRDKKKRNKCLCWSICFVVIAAAIIVGILAAVGVIGSPEAQPVQEARNFGNSKNDNNDVKSAGGLFGLSEGGNDKGHGKYPPTPSPAISTISSILPATDTSMIEVPRALDFELTIDNLEFVPDLVNKSSLEFKQLSEILERELKTILLSNAVHDENVNMELKIMEFLPGSVQVKLRVGWVIKDEQNHAQPIDKEVLENRLQQALSNNYNYMYEYHITDNSVHSNKIINLCQIDNNGCEYNCSFNYQMLDFICTCPFYKHLDSEGKRCLEGAEHKTPSESELDDFDFETDGFKTTTTEGISPIIHNVVEEKIEPEVTPEPVPTQQVFHQEEHTQPKTTQQSEVASHPEPTPRPEPQPETTSLPQPTESMIIHKEEEIDTAKPELRRNSAREGKTDDREYIEHVSHQETTAKVEDTTVSRSMYIIPEAEMHTTLMYDFEGQEDKEINSYAETTLKTVTEAANHNDSDISVIPEMSTLSKKVMDHLFEQSRNFNENMEGFNGSEENTTIVQTEQSHSNIGIVSPEENTTLVQTDQSHSNSVHESLGTTTAQPEPPATQTTLKLSSLSYELHTVTDFILTFTPIVNLEHDMNRSVEINNETTESLSNVDITPHENLIPVVIQPDISDNNNATQLRHHSMMDPTENVLDMSPFLPEIENDTLIHMVGSDSEHHDEDHTFHHIVIPPRLDKDEMNVTNPADPMPTDASFTAQANTSQSTTEFNNGVFPTINGETFFTTELNEPIHEIVYTEKELQATENITVTTNKSKEEGGQFSGFSETTTSPKIDEATPTELIANTQKSKDTTSVHSSSTQMEEREPTLSPDIINNIHSNNYFLRLQTSTPKLTDYTIAIKNFNDNNIPNTSTEDLLALETTTNNLDHQIQKIFGDNTTVVNGEIVHSVTEVVNVINSSESPSPIVVDHTTEVKITTERENALTTMFQDETHTETDHKIGGFAEVQTEIVHTTVPQTEKTQRYEVHENLSEDFTTPRTIINFTTALNKTYITQNDINDNSPLPVIPLEEKPEQPDNFSESNDFVNDITDEEKNVLDKFTTTKYSNDIQFLTTKQIFTSDDIKPVTEGFTLNGFSRCNPGQFQCRNGTSIKNGNYCIPLGDQCDSVDDCSDASDELGCLENKCFTNFQCGNGQCLKRNLVCNGVADCIDNSDEAQCDTWKCNPDEFSCSNGSRCIPLSWKCDGRPHCPNGEDEFKCNYKSCTSDTFECSDQEMCVPIKWTCDGKPDCMGGDDESFCTCNDSHFKCVQGGGCILAEQRCDGIEQCADKSDEWNCVRLQEQEGLSANVNYLEVLNNQTWIQVCSDLWNQSHSDLVCQSLGYGGAATTDFLPVEPQNTITTRFYTLKSHPKFGSRLLAQLQKTDSCSNIVSISCQDFECGSHTTFQSRTARIIGGSSTNEMQWPSLTLLYNKGQHKQCTATIIAPGWVIAGYDCVTSNNVNDWMLYAGGTNYLTNSNNATAQVRSIKRIVQHPQAKFSQSFYTRDLVLVELKTPLVLSQNVSAICLPDKDIEPQQLCVTAGWGVNKPGDISMQQYLSYLPLPTIDVNECNSTAHYNGLLPDDKICAGYTDSDKSPCYNDEGAPLMCYSDLAGSWELYGLLSHHGNCGRTHHPALYTAVKNDIRQWIMNTIGLTMTHKK